MTNPEETTMPDCDAEACGASRRQNPLPAPLATLGGALLSGVGLGSGFEIARTMTAPAVQAVARELGVGARDMREDALWRTQRPAPRKSSRLEQLADDAANWPSHQDQDLEGPDTMTTPKPAVLANPSAGERANPDWLPDAADLAADPLAGIADEGAALAAAARSVRTEEAVTNGRADDHGAHPAEAEGTAGVVSDEHQVSDEQPPSVVQSNPSDLRYEPGEVVRVKSLGDQPGRVVAVAKRPQRARGPFGLFGGGSAPKYQVVTVSGAPVVAEEGQLRRFNPSELVPAATQADVPGPSVPPDLPPMELGDAGFPADDAPPAPADDRPVAAANPLPRRVRSWRHRHGRNPEGHDRDLRVLADFSSVDTPYVSERQPAGIWLAAGLLGAAIWGALERRRERQAAAAAPVIVTPPADVAPVARPAVYGRTIHR